MERNIVSVGRVGNMAAGQRRGDTSENVRDINGKPGLIGLRLLWLDESSRHFNDPARCRGA